MNNKQTNFDSTRFTGVSSMGYLLELTNSKKIWKQVRETPTSLHVIRNMDRKLRWNSLFGVGDYD